MLYKTSLFLLLRCVKEEALKQFYSGSQISSKTKLGSSKKDFDCLNRRDRRKTFLKNKFGT